MTLIELTLFKDFFIFVYKENRIIRRNSFIEQNNKIDVQAFLYLKWNQVKYLYIVFIVSTHFIFSVVFTLYALLVYSSLCQPVDDVPKEPGQRWNIFHSYVSHNHTVK